MKKLLVISVLLMALVFSASAQKVRGGFYHGPRVIITTGWGFYPPFYPFYYPYWGYPPYGYGYAPVSKLDMQIRDIRYDYSEKIASVKMDKSLTHKERRQKIREFKHERSMAIDDAKRNYYKR